MSENIDEELGEKLFQQRIEDLDSYDPRSLICAKCKNRLPDVKLPNGIILRRPNNIKCLKFEEKPFNYMFGKHCPEFEAD